MREYLAFRLYGPMSAWGDIAVGETRPSYIHPSKSAVMGMIAAALGITRDKESDHKRLADDYGFAVQTLSFGTPLTDYHTAQVPPSGTGKNRKIFSTRKDELAAPRDELKTILSRRDYRMDSLFIATLWIRNSPPYKPLKDIKEKLKKPDYTLYLGRKSCPLALPLEPQIVTANNMREAFSLAKFKCYPGELGAVNCRRDFFWEDSDDAGMELQDVFIRRDVPLSRKRWQFDTRKEYHASFSTGG